MKSVPRDPYALQARIMDALIGDIADPTATSFPRLDALRHILSHEQPREAGLAQEAPAANHG